MAEQYEVLTEALREHATKVDGFADRLAQAVAAAREVSLPADSYGVLCQDLPLMLNPLQYLGVTVLDVGAKQLSGAAANIEHTAKSYAEIDDRNAMALNRAMEVR